MKFKHLITYIIICMTLAAASLRLSGQTTGVNLRPRVYLQGALYSLLPAATLMRDDLRAKGLIPMTEPYSVLNYQLVGGGGESISNPSVLQVTGKNAIVDWVIASRAALLQRDGDVVDLDGISPVNFSNINPGKYYVSIRHRNHLGVMSGEALDLNWSAVSFDFTDPSFPVNCTNSMSTIGNKRALWAGDVNNDGRIISQGPNNDVLKLFTTVLYDGDNIEQSANFISMGYLQADVNMDGMAIYEGEKNDGSFIWQTVVPLLFGPNIPEMFVLLECIP
ncbi:MAG: hypothetical protein GC192_05575 [Bacteroidetes bacterium]|nr:hypothetical protein [Bacteroidota bacterium]